MTSSIGKLEAFDEACEDWITYVERVEQYFLANDVETNKKVPVLLTVIGGKTYSLLRTLTSPAKPSTKTFDEIVTILQGHLSPKPLIIAERFRFHKRDQREDESINSYVAQLKKLSEHCEFGANLGDSLRDRIVCGLHNESIQKRLLVEANLTFDKAVKLAVAMETATKDSIELRRKPKPETEVNKISSEGRKQRKCYRCGKDGHDASECYFKDQYCRNCGKKGHVKRVCRSKPTNVSSSAKSDLSKKKEKDLHNVQNESDSDDTLASLELHKVDKTNCSNIIWVTPEVNGKPLRMELDTGSAVSVIPYSQYNTMFKSAKLHQTSITLKTYTGEKIEPEGLLNVEVKYKEETHQLNLYVVKSQGPALLGRDWLQSITLDWKAIKALSTGTSSPQDSPTRLQEILDKYAEVFEEGIGMLKNTKAKLTLKENSQPKFCKARQVPYALRPKVEAELTKLQNANIITKVEWSEWASPVVPVIKKNGNVRLCGDFKTTINPVLQVQQYPLPRIDDIFASLGGGQKFSKLDLRQAYLQMQMEEESRKLLTINTHKGLFQYNRLVFGVAAAPAIWQQAMDQVLEGIPQVQCILDDMIITGKTEQDHLNNLEQVLSRLHKHGLRANSSKCEFFQDKIEFCGHEISQDGLHKSQKKVDAVVNAPRPENVSQVRSFLGLINYYQHFLPNLSTLLQPLHKLLEKGSKWKWTPECEDAFVQAKKLITSEEVLAHYDPQRPIKLECDASPYGLGAVLTQVMEDNTERPIAYASRTLTKTEKHYSQIDKEALALIWGVKKFHIYLFARRFTLRTDHKPLTAIFNPAKVIPATTAARLQRYALFLAGFDYDIEYRSSTKHCNADGLSRLPLGPTAKEPEQIDDPAHAFHVSQFNVLPVTCQKVRRETQRDPTLVKVYESTMKGWHNEQAPIMAPFYSRKDELTVHQGCIMWGSRVVVPTKLRSQVLEVLHESHIGVVKMKALARSYIWWPGIDHEIEELAKGCSGCQRVQHAPKCSPLHPWEWPSTPWQRIHIDYAGPFLGMMFLVVVDACSKWPEVIMMHSTTASKTIEALRTVFARNGLPEQLVSDNGPQFIAEEFQLFLKKNGVKHITSAPYHPATNGLAERFVQTMKQSLTSMKKGPESTQTNLSRFLMKYRNTPHSTTGETPATLFMGRILRTRLDLIKPDLRKHVVCKQEKQAKSNNTSGEVRQLYVGQAVSVRNYRGKEKWIPGIVHARTGPVSYQVQIAPNVIWKRHIDQLLSSSIRTDTADCTSVPELPAMTNESVPEDETTHIQPEQRNDAQLTLQPALSTQDQDTAESEPIPMRRYPVRTRQEPERL